MTKRVTKFKEYVELHKSWISRTEPSYEAYVRSLRGINRPCAKKN